MATRIGIVNLTGCSYELAYDLLSQSVANNSSTVRLYGILHVTNNQISWTRGSASVHTSGLQAIGTYYSRGDYTVITRDFTFTHDAQGKFENAYIGASLSTTFVSGDCGGNITLPKINRYPLLNSGTNFKDTENPVYNITSYNTYPIRVKLEAGGNPQLIIRDLPASTSGNYTLQLTSAERDALRALSPNSNKLSVIETVCAMNGNTELSADFKGYTMTIVNANPTFTNFTYADVNSTTTALTGNNQKCIIGYSNIRATISTSNKATANKQATMSKYQFKCGTNTPVTANYSDSSTVNLTINKVTSGTFDVYAIDSRTNSKKVSKTATTVINYKNISINNLQSGIVRDRNNVGTGAILTLKGTMWKGSFGSVTNALTVTYRLKKTDASSWSTGTTTITPTVDSSGNISYSGSIKSNNPDYSWDLGSSYNVQVIVKDKLSTVTVNLILNSAIPTISLDKNGVGIMCAYNPSIGGLLQVGGKIIDGGKLLWTNTSSSSNFSAKTITLNSSDYDMYEIIFKISATGDDSNRIMSGNKVLKGYGTRLFVPYASEMGSLIYSRAVEYSSDTALQFYDCQYAHGTTARITSNEYIIPLYVIGYKTNLFS